MFHYSLKTVCLVSLCSLCACSGSEFSGSGTGAAQNSSDQRSYSGSQTVPVPGGTTPVPTGTSPVIGNATPTPTATIQPSLMSDEGTLCGGDQPGFGGKVFQLPVNTNALPNLTAMAPIGQIDAAQLDVPKRRWENGFPGVPNLNQWFAIRFYGVFEVPADSSYVFRTISDDGSKVYVDGNVVLNNDGVHSVQDRTGGSVFLGKGLHKIVVEWYQGPPVEIALRVFWNINGTGSVIIPGSAIKHNDLCNTTVIGSFGN